MLTKKEYIKMIIEETNNFSLLDFFTNADPYSAAIIIITPKQIIKKNVTYGYSHRDEAENLYKIMYKDFNGFENNNLTWEKDIHNKDNIVIRLTNFEGEYESKFNIITLPDSINSYQLDRLIELNKEMYNLPKEIQDNCNFIDPFSNYSPNIDREQKFLDRTIVDMCYYLDDGITGKDIKLDSLDKEKKEENILH